MAKLFAMEGDETGLGGEVLETTPEEGEVADVQVDVIEDAGEIDAGAGAIEEGIGAADQLDEVEAVVEQAAEGEGLDPVAAEAIRIAVEAICSRIGASPKAMYPLYATENYASASSRKANTKFALESVGEFIKNLWDRIKAALTNLWSKVTAFWNKHVSALGRSLKALESLKEKVTAIKGTASYKIVEVPSALLSIFPVKGTLGIDEMKNFASAADGALQEMSTFRLYSEACNISKLQAITSMVGGFKSGVEIKFGDEKQPMPGGGYFSWKYTINSETDDGVTVNTLEIEEDHGKVEAGNKNAQMDIASKDELKNLIVGAIAATKTLIKYRDKVEQRNKAVQASLKAIDKEIQGMSKDDAKTAKGDIRTFNLILSKGPQMEAKVLGFQLAFIRGLMGYVATCTKSYK